jgi:hypothetical protein
MGARRSDNPYSMGKSSGVSRKVKTTTVVIKNYRPLPPAHNVSMHMTQQL